MTQPRNSETSRVGPAGPAGEPDADHQPGGGGVDLPPARKPAWWSDADGVVDAQPTELGE